MDSAAHSLPPCCASKTSVSLMAPCHLLVLKGAPVGIRKTGVSRSESGRLADLAMVPLRCKA